MQCRKIHEAAGQRTFAVIMETGDEVVSCLEEIAAEHRIDGAGITAIGAFREATLAYFDWEAKEYRDRAFSEQLEVAALVGDVGLDEEGRPALHLHAVLGRRDHSALAGHLRRAIVRPTLEIILTESPSHLKRKKDPETGLALIRF